MSLQRIKHSLLRLSMEEKCVGIGCILIILSNFFPWYSTTFIADKTSVIENGLSGDLGVIGFILFVLALLAGLYLIGETLRLQLPYFGFKKEKVILFLMAESAFLVLLDSAIYTKRSFAFTNAELRFGIYVALIGAALGTLASFAMVQKKSKDETRAFFDHSDEKEEEMASMSELELGDEDEEKEEKENSAPAARSTQINIESYTERYRTQLTLEKEMEASSNLGLNVALDQSEEEVEGEEFPDLKSANEEEKPTENEPEKEIEETPGISKEPTARPSLSNFYED